MYILEVELWGIAYGLALQVEGKKGIKDAFHSV